MCPTTTNVFHISSLFLKVNRADSNPLVIVTDWQHEGPLYLFALNTSCTALYRMILKVILYSYLILKKMNERITDS